VILRVGKQHHLQQTASRTVEQRLKLKKRTKKTTKTHQDSFSEVKKVKKAKQNKNKFVGKKTAKTTKYN